MGIRRHFQMLCDECGDEGAEGYHSSFVKQVARDDQWSYSPANGWRCPECNGRYDRLYGKIDNPD